MQRPLPPQTADGACPSKHKPGHTKRGSCNTYLVCACLEHQRVGLLPGRLQLGRRLLLRRL